MRIFNCIDLHKTQYRSFNSYLENGCKNLNIPYIKFKFESLSRYCQHDIDILEELSLYNINRNDILIIPPYGQIINKIRSGYNIESYVLMVDLKGPSGIDSAIMVSKKIKQFSYCSPIIGDPKYEDYFSYLAQENISIYPLPYFPSFSSISNGHILSNFTDKYKEHTKSKISYLGSIWGHRESYISSIRSVLSNELIIKNGIGAKDYLNIINKSLASIDFIGAETCTYRFSEIILMGTLCVFQKRPFFMLDRPPVEMEEILIFSTTDELIEKITFCLNNPSISVKIGLNGHKWFKNTQNPKKYTSFLIKIALNKIKPIKWPLTFQNNEIDNIWSDWDTDSYS